MVGLLVNNIAMFSGGKDSTAQVILMLENNIPIDEIVMCDMGVEFPEIYNHVAKFEKYIGQKITVLKPEKPFIYWLAIHFRRKGKNPNEYYFDDLGNKCPVKKDGKHCSDVFVDTNTGYGWPDMGNRWCTAIKVATINKYLKDKRNRLEFHGIAYDEQKRIEKNKDRNIRYILNELKYTEQMALDLCYNRGFDFEGIYTKMKRVSCFCCPLQSIADLRYLYNERRELWEQMKFMDSQSFRTFQKGKTLRNFEIQFDNEKKQLKIF